MFVNPYDTTVCKDHLTANIIKTIKVADATEGLTYSVQSQSKSSPSNSIDMFKRNMALVTAKHKEVLPFAHPLLVDFPSASKIVIDARSFTKQQQNDVFVSSEPNYFFELTRASLMDHMINGSIKDLLSLGSFPMLVYSRWLSENITKRTGLNPAEQAKLVVICAFFYNSLFREDPTYNDVELSRLVQLIAKITYIPVNLCQEVADNILPMSNLKELVSQIISLIDSPRLEKFSVGLLLTIVMNSWYGVNSKEIICVGLEHPPTWLALVYAALNDRGYKNTGLAKVILANDKKDAGKSFSMNLMNLVL